MKIYSYKKGSISYEKNLIQALDIDLEKDKIITLVGAGGKTSTIFELGKEFSNLNKKTIITTTTHMGFDKDFILIEKDSDIKKIENILKKFPLIKVGKKESEYAAPRSSPAATARARAAAGLTSYNSLQ